MANRLIGIVTADAEELLSGQLARFLETVRHQPMDIIAVLRAVPERAAVSLMDDPSVIRVVRIGQAGISQARNAGISAVAQLPISPDAVICFPDDDCEYPPELAASVMRAMDGNDLLLGNYGPLGSTSCDDGQPLNSRLAFEKANSVGLFCTWQTVRTVGGFDEMLGVGSEGPQAGEDLDFILAALASGLTGFYCPQLRVIHPIATDVRPERVGVYFSVARRYWRRLPWASAVLVRATVASLLGRGGLPRSLLVARWRIHEPVRIAHL